MIAILTKWLPFYKKNEFYFAAVVVAVTWWCFVYLQVRLWCPFNWWWITAAAAAAAAARTTWHQRRVVRTAAMANKFQLVDTVEQRTPTTPPETNWKLCLVCQEETTESLVCPVLSKRRDPGSGYTTMAANFVKFDELGKLPRTVQLQRLDEGQGVEATIVTHQAKWHKTCMLQYNNTMLRRAEKKPIASSSSFAKTTVEAEPKTDHEGDMSKIVLAEHVLYMEETHLEEGTAPVFRLADLAKLYTTRMEHIGVALCKKVNSTRLKEPLIAQLPGLRAQSKGRDVLLAFDEDIGEALGKACEQHCDTEAVHLARAVQIVCRYMFEDTDRFSGSFQGGCQEDSVPNVLVAMVNMVLDRPSIKNQSFSSSTQAALSIAQLLKFNSFKQRRKQGATKTQEPPPVRHSTSQETPLPTYVELMLRAETRKRGLVDKLFSLGISYDRVLRLSAQMGNSVCQLYHIEQVVCPPTLRSNVFTTAAVDNIDHNPSATTAKIHSMEQESRFCNTQRVQMREWLVALLSLGVILDQRRLSLYQNITRMYDLLLPLSKGQGSQLLLWPLLDATTLIST